MGIQAGLANGIPLLLFTLADRQEDGLVAILGAFTALYFARFSMIDRVRTMPFIAAGFSLAAAIGTFTSGAVWSKKKRGGRKYWKENSKNSKTQADKSH